MLTVAFILPALKSKAMERLRGRSRPVWPESAAARAYARRAE